ncbi:MAG: hypothetical protein ACJ746_14685 [Bryobacteraceae bacterium]
MTDKCTRCGRTQSQVTSDAKSLGLVQEFEIGVYTCCQIVAWADEQSSAWFQATQEDNRLANKATDPPELDTSEDEALLVPVRLRRRQVPWYRHS